MLQHKIAIYVPSKIGKKLAGKALIKQWQQTIKTVFANLFGGFTVYQARGGWVGADGTLIEENVTIIQSFANSLENAGHIQALAAVMCEEMQQDAVSVEIDGTLNLIEGNKVKVA